MSAQMNRTRWIGLLVAVLVFLFDQGSKAYVTGPLGLNEQDASMTLLPFFDLRFVKNVGVSLGLLPASGRSGAVTSASRLERTSLSRR